MAAANHENSRDDHKKEPKDTHENCRVKPTIMAKITTKVVDLTTNNGRFNHEKFVVLVD